MVNGSMCATVLFHNDVSFRGLTGSDLTGTTVIPVNITGMLYSIRQENILE